MCISDEALRNISGACGVAALRGEQCYRATGNSFTITITGFVSRPRMPGVSCTG